MCAVTNQMDSKRSGDTNPPDWQKYQEETRDFFLSQGCKAETDVRIKGVRSYHNIDVFVTFQRYGITCRWIVECKLWARKVPKEKVEILKSIVNETGADRGLIISEEGFQSGAEDAAMNSNITLVTSFAEFKKTAVTAAQGFALIFEGKQNLIERYRFNERTFPTALLRVGDLLITANWGSGSISIIKEPERIILRTIDLDNYETPSSETKQIRKYPPGSLAFAGGKLFIGQVFSDFILCIDLETHAIVKRLAIPGGGEGALSASSDGQHVYFGSNKVNQLFIINPVNYQFEAFDFPGNGRGCTVIGRPPESRYIYVGVQRGSVYGGAFLAVFDRVENRFISSIPLILPGVGDASLGTPHCITYDKNSNRIFVGMFQSEAGIFIVDPETLQVSGNISFEPNEHNLHFNWVDPLSQVIAAGHLISLNRNNCEISVVDLKNLSVNKSIYLGSAKNGPESLLAYNGEIVVSYPELESLFFIKLSTLI